MSVTLAVLEGLSLFAAALAAIFGWDLPLAAGQAL